jgi:hypothetical protein
VYARAVDDAGLRLRELRREEWSDLALGAAAAAAALAATFVRPGFALPLFLGGVFVCARGLVAVWRRWDMVDELAGEPDAYVIDEILRYARKETTIQRRRAHAAYFRFVIGVDRDGRLSTVLPELEALVADLEDDTLALDPACAVACARLVGDPCRSPLLDQSAAADEVRSQVQRIRRGFVRRDAG